MATWKPAKQRGKFYVRISIGSGPTQRRLSKTIEGTTRTIGKLAEAWEAEERQLAADAAALVDDDDPEHPTLSTVWAELIRTSGPSWSPQHRSDHERVRYATDIQGLGELPVARITRADVSDYLNEYAATPVPGGKLPTDRSITARLKLIRSALTYALDTGRIDRDPTRKLPAPRGRWVEERDITDLGELHALVQAGCRKLPPSERYLERGDRREFLPLICTVAVWSGMRREEILGLKFRDVTYRPDGWADVKVRRAVTAATKDEGGYRVGPTKNERRRVVPLPPEAAKVIGDRRLALEVALAENDHHVDVEDAYVFSPSFGTHPILPASVRSWWDKLRAIEPELDRVQFKDTRASHNRKVKRALGDRGLAAAHMGHGEDVNREHYDGTQPGDLDVVRAAIAGLLDD